MGRQRKLPEGMWVRGGTYYARFRANGRLIRKRLSTDLDAAKEMLNDLRARADLASFGLINNNYPWAELKTLILSWAKQTNRPSTLAQYALDIRLFDAYCKISNVNQITTEHMIRYRGWRLAGGGNPRGKTVCPRTVNKNVGTIKLMLSLAAKATEDEGFGLIGYNPIASLAPLPHDDPKKQRRAMEWSEVEAVFTHSPDYLRPAWMTLGATGIRRGELAALWY